ncbi:MAG: hypothetical protein EXS05_19620 [Planctomycetaceae bacterium]|nr:hypothetical protein [Planctomycetaceae bacterium]
MFHPGRMPVALWLLCVWASAPWSAAADDTPVLKAGPSRPTQVFWESDATNLMVVESGTDSLATVSLEQGRVSWRQPLRFEKTPEIAVGPRSYAINPVAKQLAVIGPWNPHVSLFSGSLAGGFGRISDETALPRYVVAPNPQGLAYTPNGEWLLVACDPPGRGDRPIFFVHLKSGVVARRPIPGSSNLRGIAVDPQGQFSLAVHLVPKSDLPATQIEQGWVFTNAISFVPLDPRQPIVTLPLDLRTQGFANPEGIAIAPDGRRAYVTHAGADVVSVIDLPALVALTTDTPRAPGYDRRDDLRLTRRYVKARIAVGANPRGVAVSADGKFVAVANRLDDSISLIDAATSSVIRTIALQAAPSPPADDLVLRGEKLFFSGKLSYSGQFSCTSCHPDGHADGLNWDLPADGFNNFQNTKTLLGVAGTAPYGWSGGSPSLKERFTGTLQHLFQHEPGEDEVAALDAYLTQLDYPANLPLRVDSRSPAAQRGRSLFLGVARCHECHNGPKLTDRLSHDVGTGSERSAAYDTPSLIHIGETATYLHDGRAQSLDEIFTRFNSEGLHGGAADLSAEELADLAEYLRSL